MMVTGVSYIFYNLSTELSAKLDLALLPFPIRKSEVETIFNGHEVLFDSLLKELDLYLKKHPEMLDNYQSNVARLALISAIHHGSRSDAASALNAINLGLRSAPQNSALLAHQAFALQLNQYPEAAAMQYELLLDRAPYAYDPLLHALAARAFIASGEPDRAIELLDPLPSQYLEEPSLRKLRGTLPKSAVTTASELTDEQLTSTLPESVPVHVTCLSCGSIVSSAKNFCIHCGVKKCPSCGAFSYAKNYCSECGAPALTT